MGAPEDVQSSGLASALMFEPTFVLYLSKLML